MTNPLIRAAFEKAQKDRLLLPVYQQHFPEVEDYFLRGYQAATSAAMQWMPIETAPMGKSGDNSTYFIGMRADICGRQNTATCYRNKHGAYEWWGGGLQPEYWMPLPTPPSETNGEK